jgi:REP element-mobilizing transposase RayT
MYHVTARGNHRQDIFFKHGDRQLLDDIMSEALERTGSRVHAYCWMTNHVHLLVQVGEQPLARLMQRVGSRFARTIQQGLRTTGHLFENRYHALLVDVDSYFLELLRYIHLNPVRAHIVSSAHEYRWSSHRVYLGKCRQSWVHTDFGLRMFSSDEAQARSRYRAFVDSQVPTIDPMRETHPYERRVLGDDRFLERLSVPVSRRNTAMTLDAIADDVCRRFAVDLDAVRSASRNRLLSQARAQIADRAIHHRVSTLSEVARFLNRSSSALSRAVERYRFTAE